MTLARRVIEFCSEPFVIYARSGMVVGPCLVREFRRYDDGTEETVIRSYLTPEAAEGQTPNPSTEL